MPLNVRQIKLAKTESRDLFLSDGNGLYLRVRSSGLKSWLYRYKDGSKTRWVELGTFNDNGLSLADARLTALNTKKLRKEGIDPATEKKLSILRNQEIQLSEQAAIEAKNARLSVNELFQKWQKIDLINHKDQGDAISKIFIKNVLPEIGHKAVADIKKSDIIHIVDVILARGAERMAKMTLSLMRQMFRFAQDRDIIEIDPTATIRKYKIGKPETERDRVLNEEEIRELISKLPKANLKKSTETAVLIALATGCRIGELLKARWSEIDFDKKIWLIPEENSKNGEALKIYLSEFATNQFRVLKSINHETIWCYPDRAGSNHVCTKTITKQVTDRQLNTSRNPMSNRSKDCQALVLPGGKWTCHDLRRTTGTMMTALGVLPDIADKCLNHKEQNRIRRTYLRHNYENEKREVNCV